MPRAPDARSRGYYFASSPTTFFSRRNPRISSSSCQPVDHMSLQYLYPTSCVFCYTWSGPYHMPGRQLGDTCMEV